MIARGGAEVAEGTRERGGTCETTGDKGVEVELVKSRTYAGKDYFLSHENILVGGTTISTR
jgi:hypothetical protein